MKRSFLICSIFLGYINFYNNIYSVQDFDKVKNTVKVSVIESFNNQFNSVFANLKDTKGLGLQIVSLDGKDTVKDASGANDSKSLLSIVRAKSIYLYNSIISLMFKCDKYIEFWQYRKKNIGLYLLSNGSISNIFKAKRDLIEDIDKKIRFFEEKKKEYSIFAGKVYKISEIFIEGSKPDLKDDQINSYVQSFTKQIDDILPENYTQDYFMLEKKELKKFMSDDKTARLRKKYYIAGASTIVLLTLMIVYRKTLTNFAINFWSNNIVKPFSALKEWFLIDSREDKFLSLSPKELQDDLEAQKDIISGKVEDFAKELNPKIKKDALDKLLLQAKEIGVEGIVAKCIKKARVASASDIIKTETKPGWIEWMIIGNKLNKSLGMSPKAKLIEVEIKVLMSRLLATKILVDAKDMIDSNRLTMVAASFLPMALTGFGVYKAYRIGSDFYNGVPKKKKDVDEMVLRIGEIINKNICNAQLDYSDQGFLCYYVAKFRKSLDVVSQKVRATIAKDLSHITSSINSPEKKFQILQGMKVMLYVK